EYCTGSSAACPADTYNGLAICWLGDLGTNGNEVAGSTISITPLAGSVAVGHGVIVTVAMDPDSGTVSCADSQGNTYSKDAEVTNGSGTTGVRTLVFSTRVTTALSSADSITVTFQNSIVAKAIGASEFYGMVALDRTATFIGDSTAPSSGLTALTTQPTELLFGAIGVVDASAQCDDGANNGTTGDCCNTDCTFTAAGTQCRAAGDLCDVAETCTGSSSTCPADGIASAGTVCRPAVNECDLAETCTGTSTACPADAAKPAAPACTDDGNVCTTDVCNGTLGAPACTHPAGNAGTVCRASAGLCDVAETCTGTATTCPTDGFQPSTVVCRASAGECDPQETCIGTG